jgi:uncharacterized protein (TIGR03000 family)
MKHPLRIVSFLAILLAFTSSAWLARNAGAQKAAAPDAAKSADKKPIKLIVLVPESYDFADDEKGETKLWLFDSLMDAKGTKREFTTQPLEVGKKYFYDLRMQYEPNNYTTIIRRLRFGDMEPGKTYTIDLTKKNPKLADEIKVRWVATPKSVVDIMLKQAKTKRGNVVYDLGCGDGIIVITAVKEFGASRGVGVDIDPKMIEKAKVAAKEAGVADKLEFRIGDVLKQVGDIEKADVVALYMGEDINIRLKPILRKRMKIGARVVSHRFKMGDDWPPQKTVKHVQIEDGKPETYFVHLWTIGPGDKKAANKPAKDDDKE